MKSLLLSKSTFIRSLQCAKSLYLHKMQYEMKDELSDEQQALFTRGYQTGALARQLFPGGKDAGWKSPRQYKRSVMKTAEFIQTGARVIYEAAFLHEDVLVALDILVRKEDGWYGYEVKSGTRVTDTYARDAALQYHIITEAGLPLKQISIIHIDKTYRRNKKLEPGKLFAIADVTEAAKQMLPFVRENLLKAREVLTLPEPPDIDPGPHCEKPYPCDFRGYCWQGIGDDSVLHLAHAAEDVRWQWHSSGITTYKEVPEEMELSAQQKIEIESRKSGQVYIDRPGLARWMAGIKFPAAFLHPEYLWTGIPLVQQSSPYQRLVFGYSMQRMGHICAPAEEATFLSETGGEVQLKLLENLLAETEALKQVVVFNEKEFYWALKPLEKQFPAHAPAISRLLHKVTGMSGIFEQMLFYHPAGRQVKDTAAMAATLGIEAALSLHPAAIEQLFYEKNFFAISAWREQIMKYMQQQSAVLLGSWKMLREESLAATEQAKP